MKIQKALVQVLSAGTPVSSAPICAFWLLQGANGKVPRMCSIKARLRRMKLHALGIYYAEINYANR